MVKRLYHRLVSSVAACSVALAPLAGRANPLGGQVVGGSATIQGQSSGQVTINQTTSRAIINWNTFNIAPGETTEFRQPDAASVTLNRVTGGTGASQIHGTINASGSVYVVNPDGILFGRTATVNVGSFLATTHDIRNDDFMAGRNSFTISGNPSASIVNQGTITAAQGGFAALVAPGVRNDGVITAKLGTVALASGNAFTLDLYGDSLIKLQASDAIAAEVRDVATGQPLSNLVHNTGTIRANGGRVQLSAVTARRAVDSVINTSGVIEANTVGTQRGMVVFGAATGSTKVADAPVQRVRLSGTINVSGRRKNETGGTVKVTGESIELSSLTVDASGKAGGGKILIGGDYRGGAADPALIAQYGIAYENNPIPTSTSVSADAGVTLNASAIQRGDGGKVVVWSDGRTSFSGTIKSNGGHLSGNGGFVEVSGESQLMFDGSVSTTAKKGKTGTVLFDPPNLYVVSDDQQNNITGIGSPAPSGSQQGLTSYDSNLTDSPPNSVIRASTINSNLLTSNVVLRNVGGEVHIDAPIVMPATPSSLYITSSTGSLVPTAFDLRVSNIYLNAPIDASRSLGSIYIETAGSLFVTANGYIVAQNSINTRSNLNQIIDLPRLGRGVGFSDALTVYVPSNPVEISAPEVGGRTDGLRAAYFTGNTPGTLRYNFIDYFNNDVQLVVGSRQTSVAGSTPLMASQSAPTPSSSMGSSAIASSGTSSESTVAPSTSRVQAVPSTTSLAPSSLRVATNNSNSTLASVMQQIETAFNQLVHFKDELNQKVDVANRSIDVLSQYGDLQDVSELISGLSELSASIPNIPSLPVAPIELSTISGDAVQREAYEKAMIWVQGNEAARAISELFNIAAQHYGDGTDISLRAQARVWTRSAPESDDGGERDG